MYSYPFPLVRIVNMPAKVLHVSDTSSGSPSLHRCKFVGCVQVEESHLKQMSATEPVPASNKSSRNSDRRTSDRDRPNSRADRRLPPRMRANDDAAARSSTEPEPQEMRKSSSRFTFKKKPAAKEVTSAEVDVSRSNERQSSANVVSPAPAFPSKVRIPPPDSVHYPP